MGFTFGLWLEGIKGNDNTWIMSIAALVTVVFCKNSMEIIDRVRPNCYWFLLILIIAFWSFLDLNKVSEFLYFQF
jgi:hypothetical protein